MCIYNCQQTIFFVLVNAKLFLYALLCMLYIVHIIFATFHHTIIESGMKSLFSSLAIQISNLYRFIGVLYEVSRMGLLRRKLSSYSAGMVQIKAAKKLKYSRSITKKQKLSQGSGSSYRRAVEAGSCIRAAEAGSCIRAVEAGSCIREVEAGSCIREVEAGSCIREVEAGSCIRAAEAGSCIREVEAGSCIREVEAGSCIREVEAGSCIREVEAGSCIREVEAGSCIREVEAGSCTRRRSRKLYQRSRSRKLEICSNTAAGEKAAHSFRWSRP